MSAPAQPSDPRAVAALVVVATRYAHTNAGAPTVTTPVRSAWRCAADGDDGYDAARAAAQASRRVR